MTPAERDNIFQTALDKGVYTKNIDYIYTDARLYGPDNMAALNEITKLGGTPTQTAWFLENGFKLAGRQVQVSKEVSDDLIRTEFEAESQMDNIPWPAPFVEMYFEDPKLPSILLSKTGIELRRKLFPRVNFTGDRLGEELAAMIQEGQYAQSTLLLTPGLYKRVLFEGEYMPMENYALLNADLNDMDSIVLNKLVKLALSVFVFMSIERYKPATLTHRVTRAGNKPGIVCRPSLPSQRVFYAPNVKYINKERSQFATGTKKRFFGRIGHWRFYKDKRYTFMFEKWDFIPEIEVEGATKPIIKVRKPE